MEDYKKEWLLRQRDAIRVKLDAEVLAARECISLMQRVAAVLPEIDGKVINKRIDAVIAGIIPEESRFRESADLSYYRYAQNSMVLHVKVDRRNCAAEYYYYTSIDAPCVIAERGKRDRFSAGEMLQAIETRIATFQEKILGLEDELGNLNDLVTEYAKIWDQASALQRKVTPIFRNLLNFEEVY